MQQVALRHYMGAVDKAMVSNTQDHTTHNPEGRKNIWEQLKEIPPIIASLITVIAAIAAIVTWLFAYFASQQQLEEVRQEVERAKCVAHLSNYITDRKIEQKVGYDELLSYRTIFSRLQEKQRLGSLTEDERKNLVEADAKINMYRDQISIANDREKDARRVLSSNEVLNSNGKCKL